jgi:hypothetical protein
MSQETTPLLAYRNGGQSGHVACMYYKQSWNPTPNNYGQAVRTTHGRIFNHLLHLSEPDAQKNLCRAALLHLSGSWECCSRLLDVHESKPPVEACPMRNQFKTPGGDEHLVAGQSLGCHSKCCTRCTMSLILALAFLFICAARPIMQRVGGRYPKSLDGKVSI